MKALMLVASFCSIALLFELASSNPDEPLEEEPTIEEQVLSFVDIQADTDVVQDGERQYDEKDDGQIVVPLHEHDVQHSLEPEEETARHAYNLQHDDISFQTRAALIKQQVKRVGVGVDQLKQILVELQEEEDEAERSRHGFTGFESVDEDDDRTLLDVFGETAKDYLTKKVIPDTDPECRWKWQSMRCEPACDCELKFKRGDYHLGRACRLRALPVYQCDESKLKPVVNQRLVSLVQQTAQIIGDKIKNMVRRTSEPVCRDLTRLRDALGNQCLPAQRIPNKTLPQRLLCRSIGFAVCPEETAEDDFLYRAYSRL